MTLPGAYVIQALAQKLSKLLGDLPNYGQGKECDCVVLLIAHLYNFKVGEVDWMRGILIIVHVSQVIHCLLIYDIIWKLVESFTERDVELLLLLLKSAYTYFLK